MITDIYYDQLAQCYFKIARIYHTIIKDEGVEISVHCDCYCYRNDAEDDGIDYHEDYLLCIDSEIIPAQNLKAIMTLRNYDY